MYNFVENNNSHKLNNREKGDIVQQQATPQTQSCNTVVRSALATFVKAFSAFSCFNFVQNITRSQVTEIIKTTCICLKCTIRIVLTFMYHNITFASTNITFQGAGFVSKYLQTKYIKKITFNVVPLINRALTQLTGDSQVGLLLNRVIHGLNLYSGMYLRHSY